MAPKMTRKLLPEDILVPSFFDGGWPEARVSSHAPRRAAVQCSTVHEQCAQHAAQRSSSMQIVPRPHPRERD